MYPSKTDQEAGPGVELGAKVAGGIGHLHLKAVEGLPGGDLLWKMMSKSRMVRLVNIW